MPARDQVDAGFEWEATDTCLILPDILEISRVMKVLCKRTVQPLQNLVLGFADLCFH